MGTTLATTVLYHNPCSFGFRVAEKGRIMAKHEEDEQKI